MKTFLIRLKDNKDSIRSAEQTIQSAKKVGYSEPIELFDAITPNNWETVLPFENNFHLYPRPYHVAACFASHYLLWKKCIELNEPILILEHDAIFVDNIPNDLEFNLCINFGRPSYIRPDHMLYVEPQDGVGILKQKNYLGHHAYAITPSAAKIFCYDVSRRPLTANDIWIDKFNYEFLEEYRPYPIIADTDFSTIQAPVLVEVSKDDPLKPLSDPNNPDEILKGYKKLYPGLKCWEEGTEENKFLLKYFPHTLKASQSSRYIKV